MKEKLMQTTEEVAQTELTNTLTDLLKRLSERPDMVMVRVSSPKENEVSFIVDAPSEERGFLIGKNGQIMRSVRTIMRSIACKHGFKVYINLEGEEEDVDPRIFSPAQ
jgi:predicted RNA-binding protein YlqC (UPF0109 family)